MDILRGYRYVQYFILLMMIMKKQKNRIIKIEKEHNKKVYVRLLKADIFYAAEEYHQNYHIKNPKEYKIEFDSSGRKNKPTIGKIKVDNNYYQVELFNGEIINIQKCDAFSIYNNPKSIISDILPPLN